SSTPRTDHGLHRYRPRDARALPPAPPRAIPGRSLRVRLDEGGAAGAPRSGDASPARERERTGPHAGPARRIRAMSGEAPARHESPTIQPMHTAVSECGLGGWLLFDFHGPNPDASG